MPEDEIKILFDDEPKKKIEGAIQNERETCKEEGTRDQAHPSESFLMNLREAFEYPYKGEGKFILIGGLVVYFVLYVVILLFGSLLNPLTMMIAIVYFSMDAYVFLYLMKIVNTTGIGKKRLPDWPDLTEMIDDVFRPVLLLFGSVFLSFALPTAILFLIFGISIHSFIAASLFAYLYFPMQFIAVSVIEDIRALNPLLVFQSIAKVPVRYSMHILSLVIANVASIATFLLFMNDLPVLSWVVVHFFFLYVNFAHARLLGKFYRENKEALQWFGKSRNPIL